LGCALIAEKNGNQAKENGLSKIKLRQVFFWDDSAFKHAPPPEILSFSDCSHWSRNSLKIWVIRSALELKPRYLA
jgi:hypothetical protein